MDLYHSVKIGNLELDGNLFLAPVAGYTDKAFRSICVEAGASFSYTELISAEALVRGNENTVEMLQAAPCEKKYAVQLFGSNPETMAKALKIVLEKSTCSCIDINCGCPVPKVIKTGAGSALTRDPERLYAVTKATVDAAKAFAEDSASGSGAARRFPVPVTVKIRSGWDSQTITWKEASDAAISAGAAAITLHPRTRSQGYEGKADWQCLADLVEFVREKNLCGEENSSSSQKVQVFGSGDLFTPEDAKKMLEQTKCDGVMFARGAMGNPFIFSQTINFLQNGSYEEPDSNVRIKTGMRELELLAAERGEARACMEMRKRFCSYTKGMAGGARLRAEIVHAETIEDYKLIIEN